MGSKRGKQVKILDREWVVQTEPADGHCAERPLANGKRNDRQAFGFIFRGSGYLNAVGIFRRVVDNYGLTALYYATGDAFANLKLEREELLRIWLSGDNTMNGAAIVVDQVDAAAIAVQQLIRLSRDLIEYGFCVEGGGDRVGGTD